MHFLRNLFDVFPFSRKDIIQRYLTHVQTILDAGSGKGNDMEFLNKRMRLFSVGVDLFRPWIQHLKNKKIHSDYVHCDIRQLPFKTGSFDAALCSEVIEHLEKVDGFAAINELERVAFHQVVITTPNGFMCYEESEGNPFQKHKSSWEPIDFIAKGYEVRGSGFRCLHMKRES